MSAHRVLQLSPPSERPARQQHEVTHGICSCCGKSFPVGDMETDQEGDFENGYYDIHLCPECPDGGCVDDYS